MAILGVRPHDVTIVPPAAGTLTARVDAVEPRGADLLVRLRAAHRPGAPLVAVVAPDAGVAADQEVGLALDPARLHWFDAESGRRLTDSSEPAPEAIQGVRQ
jgi:multiple sugar transport system ATP-binding protein